MINLLPYERKAEVRAARLNTTLANYILLSLIALGLVSGIVIFSYISLSMIRVNAQARVDENVQKIAGYSKISQEASSFRSDLSVAKQILDKELAYSSLLIQFAKYVPKGIVIDNLPIDQKILGTPTTINAHASSSDTALAFKTLLETQPTLFSDVRFDSLTFESQPADPVHPINITMSITFKKDTLQQ